ncbi:MAG TPA: UDP-3-O-acyl-N-acetylglucosamine deacetylase, partial [Methylomirabilota bacterium]|nr:UDP-3-O-acyl-N-acetylglucosamine deacetylase [Methylomirabilota bacterium]
GKESAAGGRFPALGDDRVAPLDLAGPPPLRLVAKTEVPQRTLRASTVLYGLGLHSGARTGMALLPLPPDSGIHVVTLPTRTHVPVHVDSVADTDYATTLAVEGQSIRTVEHLLSALHALGVDDVRVEVDGPEIPIMDGSAAPFVILIHEAGLRPLAVSRRYLKVLKPVEVVRGGKWTRLSPADHFTVTYTIGFDHPLLRHQAFSVRVAPHIFATDVAPARTFGFLREVETLRRAGLALGGSLENAVVIGETGVLNSNLRFEDEFVRHKILDAIGDLALLGHPLVGHLEAEKAGHAVHTALARKLLATPEAWTLAAFPSLPAFDLPQAGSLAIEPA